MYKLEGGIKGYKVNYFRQSLFIVLNVYYSNVQYIRLPGIYIKVHIYNSIVPVHSPV